MFISENDMQLAVHQDPGIILSGIPEANPEFCPDVPGLISLGREIQLASGPIDNLFIDANAILTFVECKRYSDSRIKREVYPQAVNYAADLKNQLIHYNGDDFHLKLSEIILSAKGSKYQSMEAILSDLSDDPLLSRKDLSEWRHQFLNRLELNIKSGACRIILLCGSTHDNVFNFRAIRNLMQLMSFSERPTSLYDLILMDLREERDCKLSRIIWRRYAPLPQIPLIAETVRDTSIGIDRMKVRESCLPPDQKLALRRFIEELSSKGIIAVENTYGYALKRQSSKKSLYITIEIRDKDWIIIRHQIGHSEPLYSKLKIGEKLPYLSDTEVSTVSKESSTGSGEMFEIRITPTTTNNSRLLDAVLKLGSVEKQNTAKRVSHEI